MTLKKSENNGTEEIGLVNPTPGWIIFTTMNISHIHYHEYDFSIKQFSVRKGWKVAF